LKTSEIFEFSFTTRLLQLISAHRNNKLWRNPFSGFERVTSELMN